MCGSRRVFRHKATVTHARSTTNCPVGYPPDARVQPVRVVRAIATMLWLRKATRAAPMLEGSNHPALRLVPGEPGQTRPLDQPARLTVAVRTRCPDVLGLLPELLACLTCLLSTCLLSGPPMCLTSPILSTIMGSPSVCHDSIVIM